MSDLILTAIAMIEKSQVLSTVQQIKLRKLELEVEALREQVQHQCNSEEQSLAKADSDITISPSASSAMSQLK
ncbi:MAG: hypothetical protein ACFCAD_05225 [Pleurocapsa sp.]